MYFKRCVYTADVCIQDFCVYRRYMHTQQALKVTYYLANLYVDQSD